MREILLTSSVLILAVLLLRLAFRDRISRRAQYALWGLVLLRLLVPVSLPGVDFSVLSAVEPVGQAVAERLEQRMVYAMPTEVYDYADPGQSGARDLSISEVYLFVKVVCFYVVYVSWIYYLLR